MLKTMVSKDEVDIDDTLAQLHLVDGLLRALDDPNLVALIDKSVDRPDASERLIAAGYSERQAARVLDMAHSRRTLQARTDLIEHAQRLRAQLPTPPIL